jgi:hypothetical protein
MDRLAGKTEFTEAEAAESLGVPVEQLRSWAVHLALAGHASSKLPPNVLFRPADLILFRMWAARRDANHQQGL